MSSLVRAENSKGAIGEAISATGKAVWILDRKNECCLLRYPSGNEFRVSEDSLSDVVMYGSAVSGRSERAIGDDELKSRIQEGLKHLHGMCSYSYVDDKEERTMGNKYGDQSHDQIFEALVEQQYYEVGVQFEDSARIYRYRVPRDIELIEEDNVIVEASRGGPSFVKLATVTKVYKNKERKATAWVIQKVELTAHQERQQHWTTLYEGIKTAEMAKKRAILADGYESELAMYAPEAAEALAALNEVPQLESKTDTND